MRKSRDCPPCTLNAARFCCAGRILDAERGEVLVPQLLSAWKRPRTAVVVGRFNILGRLIGFEACGG